MLPWTLLVISCILIFMLTVKLALLHKSLNEISTELRELLASDSNGLICLSSGDRHARRLATDLNKQLRILRRQRQRYLNGDRELKEAVTNISHDLRTPLTAICGYLELLEQTKQSEEAAQYLLRINGRVEMLKQLTEELFRYSVIVSVPENTKEDVILNQVLEQALLSYYAAFQAKRIIPDIKITEQAVHKSLDLSSLNRVFENILSNVVKYAESDLSVEMNESGVIRFSNTANNLSTTEVGRLFDRFYTVENGRNANGLGLSIARLLTERMGGNITAEYRQNRLILTLEFNV